MDEKINYASEVMRRIHTELPGLDPALAQLYALLALTKGTETSLKDVHDAWSLWTAVVRGSHKSLIPFNQLTPAVQELDRKYMEGIHRASELVSSEDGSHRSNICEGGRSA
jgi:hypothetical protein